MSETPRTNDAMRKRLTKLSIEAIDYWRDRAERAEARVTELERELAEAARCPPCIPVEGSEERKGIKNGN